MATKKKRRTRSLVPTFVYTLYQQPEQSSQAGQPTTPATTTTPAPADVMQSLKVSKAFNEELQQATFVVMVPDEIDLHGDITSAQEVAAACYNYNQYCMKANLFHLAETQAFSIIESYIAPTDFVLGNKLVTKGTWLCTVQVHQQWLWDEIKLGNICSVSIGAMAVVEDLE